MKLTKDEKADLVVKLAKEKYGEMYLAGLWGSSKVLLSEKNLDVMLKVMEK